MTRRPPVRRLVGLFSVFVLAMTGVAVRLVLLQARDAGAYQAIAQEQRVRTIPLPAPRGTIFDRDGQELAVSLPAKAVYADPLFVHDARTEAKVVAGALGLPQADVERRLRTGGRFVYLARQVDQRVAERLAARHLPGIGFLTESRRYYPAGVIAPQMLGFVGVDGQGLAGIELEDQSLLAGKPGRRVQEEDPSGVGFPEGRSSDIPPVPGRDVVTTIDKDLQFQAQRALAEAVRTNEAKGGTILVMDPRGGEVLAMASYPWFDPQHYGRADPQSVKARAITDVYEPGSVNKVITASAAIEERLFSLSTAFPTPDNYLVGHKVFHDAHPHGVEQMTLADIIAFSSNVGTIRVAQTLGQPRLASYLDRFGFGRPTGIGFPGEAKGIVPPADGWWGTSMATIPVGQGIAVTPLQMACVYATIANGGVWVQPRLVRGTMGPGGAFEAAPAGERRRVVSSTTAREVGRILAYAVEVGTGQEAQIPGYWVAGKTGTARKPLENALGYSDRYVASFIGFLPASRPRLVIAAVIDEPVTEYGGVAAAPLFQEVGRYALAHLRIPPAPMPPIPPHAVPTG